MAVALVGFDVDNRERVYGIHDVGVDAQRRRRNRLLKEGTHRLYLLFLELLQRAPQVESRATARLMDVARTWGTLLVPLVWWNSQTPSLDYQGLTRSSKLYWEGNLNGFGWPTEVPLQPGMWAPYGSLAYYYFHYGVTQTGANPLDYVEGALVLYWRYLSEQFGEVELSYAQPPATRWQRIKQRLGWVSFDYAKVEQVLENWLVRGTNLQLQAEMRRALFSPAHYSNLERKLLLGSLDPNLLSFLIAHRGELNRDLQRLGVRESLRLDLPVAQRWKLGAGGVPQVLFAFLVESLVLVAKVFVNYGGVEYGSFLGELRFSAQRRLVLDYLALGYDALLLLGDVYQNLEEIQSELVLMLIELFDEHTEVLAEGAYRLREGVPLDVNWLLSQISVVDPTPDLGVLAPYPEAERSLVTPGLFDRIRLVSPPRTVQTDKLVLLKVEGRPGFAVAVSLVSNDYDVFVYSKRTLIQEDGYAYIPVLFWNTTTQPKQVNVSVRVVDAPAIAVTFSVLVGSLGTETQRALRHLPTYASAQERIPLSQVIQPYAKQLERAYRLEYDLLAKVNPVEMDVLVERDPVEDEFDIWITDPGWLDQRPGEGWVEDPAHLLPPREDEFDIWITDPGWLDRQPGEGWVTDPNWFLNPQLPIAQPLPLPPQDWAPPQRPGNRERPRDGQKRRAGSGSDILGQILGNIMKAFGLLFAKTSPVSANERQLAKFEQNLHFSAAEATVKCGQQACEVQKVAQQTDSTTKQVAPQPIRQEIDTHQNEVVKDTGGAIAAATAASAYDVPTGRQVVQSHEVWQINTQHARIHTTANLEVNAPQALFTNQVLNLQVRHRVGIHDQAQDTAQYLWYRATKLRQSVAEQNIDFTNNWYKATSANAHYVAGHHYQYGDELLVQVGRVKQDEEEKDLEGAQDQAANATADTEVDAPPTAEGVSEAAQAAEGVEGAQQITNQAVQATRWSTQQLTRAMQVLNTVAEQTGLGPLNQGIQAVFGVAGAFTNALGMVANATGEFGQAFNTAMGILGQIEQGVRLVSGIQAQIAQGLGGGGGVGSGGGSGGGGGGDGGGGPEALDQQLQTALSELDALIESSAPELISNLTKVAQEAQRISTASGTSTAAIQKLITDITSGKYDSAVRVNEFAPYKAVLAGDGMAMLDMASKALAPLAQAIGGDVAGKAVQIATSVASGIISAVQGFNGLGSTGNLASSFAGGAIPGVSQALSMVPGVGTAFQAAAQAFGNIPGLGAVSAATDALGMSAMVPLHPENSQVGKYGNYIIDVYRDMTIGVKMGNYRVRALKDISLMTKLGRLRGHGLILSMHGRKQAEFGSEGQTILRGLDVRVDAEVDAVVKGEVVHIKGEVIYLDSGSIICGTRPVVGDMPSLEAISDAATLVEKAQQIMNTIQKYMEYLQMALSALGLGSGGGAPHMSSPQPVPTAGAPVNVQPRPQPGDQNPLGAAIPQQTTPQPPVIPSQVISPELALYYGASMPSEHPA